MLVWRLVPSPTNTGGVNGGNRSKNSNSSCIQDALQGSEQPRETSSSQQSPEVGNTMGSSGDEHWRVQGGGGCSGSSGSGSSSSASSKEGQGAADAGGCGRASSSGASGAGRSSGAGPEAPPHQPRTLWVVDSVRRDDSRDEEEAVAASRPHPRYGLVCKLELGCTIHTTSPGETQVSAVVASCATKWLQLFVIPSAPHYQWLAQAKTNQCMHCTLASTPTW